MKKTKGSIRFRQALPEDVEQLLRLRWAFHAQDASPEELSRFVTSAGPWFRQALSEPRWRVWVAEEAGELLSQVWVYHVPQVPEPPDRIERGWGYVTNVYTKPQHRGSGIGAGLMRQVIDWADEQGLGLLLVWPSDESVPFYERSGFRPPEESLRELTLHHE
jgi:GNAT superfamily N-acetyltransferase